MITLILNGSSKNTLDVFSDFVPLEYEHYMYDENAILVGVVEAGENGLEAGGITILAEDDGRLVIKWMCVDPDHQFSGYGSKMLDICFNIATENDLSVLSAQIPIFEDEGSLNREDRSIDELFYDSLSPESDTIAGFFYGFGFHVTDKSVRDGIPVNMLTADVDMYQNMGNDYENELLAEARQTRGYDRFPSKFIATGVEYFSGI